MTPLQKSILNAVKRRPMTLRELQKMRFPQATGNAAADEGYHQLYDYLKRAWDDSVTELAIDYVSTFIGHGVNGYSAAYPYESVYTSERRLLMQEARAEVLAKEGDEMEEIQQRIQTLLGGGGSKE